ncbi:MAG TPA: AMP-binding protein [Ilumatobacteraceae bacterium]|nr:AMP-binding protein [Ilumatobacteraceae bacterium]
MRFPDFNGSQATTMANGRNITWLLQTRTERRPDHPFIVWEPLNGPTETFTYTTFSQRVAQVAAGLRQRDVRQGERVVVHLENCPEFLFAWFALARIGAVAVCTNARSSVDEIRHFGEHSQAVAAITQPKFAGQVAQALPGLRWIAVTETDAGEAVATGDRPGASDAFASLYGDAGGGTPADVGAFDPAWIQYTSGTTSRPKAVVLTHANALWGGKVSALQEDLRSTDVHLVHLPLFHINALCYSVLSSLFVGATAVLQPRFSASRFWDVSLRHGCTWASMIPFAIRALAAREIPAEHSYRIWGAGASSPPDEALFRVRMLAWYGMTETVIHAVRDNKFETGSHPVIDEVYSPGRPYAMGRPSPAYEVALLHEDGTRITPGETGSVFVRGVPGLSLFAEYLHDQAATREAVDERGWLHTGDTATLHEDGYLSFADRAKDLLKVGGENVAASEIERVIVAVAGVSEVAVVAAKHRMLDEVPVAFVIGSGANPDLAADVLAACKAQLADFKVPREVRVVDEMPRSTLNKIAKAELRKTLPTFG